MNELLILVTMGVLVEAVVEVIKSIYENGKVNKIVVLSIFVGLTFAFTLGIDLFSLIGIDTNVAYVGVVATGLIVSRGANFVHDLIDKLQNPTLQDGK